MNRSLGYVLAALGVLALIGSFEPIQQAMGITPLNSTAKYIVLAIGVVFIVLGVVAMNSGSKKQEQEVPIYHGERIVGYRRVKS